jgi:dihydrofolate reductase
MRRVRYSVAASLDGYIADSNGGYDWITDDPTIDLASMYQHVDTFIMGRRTFDLVREQGSPPWSASARVYVFSTTLSSDSAPGVTIVSKDPIAFVSSLRHEEGAGEIWLFGGGQLFSTLLRGRQVDAVEVAIMPVLLGAGIPLLAPGCERAPLTLTKSQPYPSGIVMLYYNVPNSEL